MYHEHHTSKMYTATSLGEIMSQRVWTSFNTINANRKRDTTEKRLILDDTNNITEKSPEDWDVRGLWMLHDTIEAIRWAWILLTYGSENSINKYVNWFQGLLRKHAQRVPNVKALWEDFSWDIAMRMRNKETFATVTEDLMADLTKTNEILQQPLTKKPRTGKGQGQQNTRYKGYQPKWSPPGKGRRYRTADGSPWQSWSSSSSPTTLQTWTPTSPTWSPTTLPNWPAIPASLRHRLRLTAEPDSYLYSDPPLAAQGQRNKGNKGSGKKGKGGKGGKK